jgi:hypothetical protein
MTSQQKSYRRFLIIIKHILGLILLILKVLKELL